MSLRTEAEAYARVLEIGLVPAVEVAAWIDSLIASSPTPCPELCVASTTQGDQKLASALRAIPRDTDEATVTILLLGHMHRVLHTDERFASCVSRELFQIALDGRAPTPEAEALMFTFDDDLDLAQLGYTGDRDKSAIIQELREFLATFATPA